MAQAPIGAVERLFDIIETIQVQNGAGVSDLATELDMAKSTVHGHLATLKQRGYLVQDDTSQYHLSLKFLTLGGSVRQGQTIYNDVEHLLAEIAGETGENINYVIESQGEMTIVGSVLGDEGIRTEVDMGYRSDLHTTPEGKLILAFLPEWRRRELLAEIDFPIENTVGKAAFTSELDEIRDAGVAYGNETIVKNVATVSVPVIDNEDTFYGAIVVAGPSLRFTPDRVESIKETLQYKVGKLNIDLTYGSQDSAVEDRLGTR